MILPPAFSRKIRAGAPLGWLASKARARTPATVAVPPGGSSVTSTANRRRTREEPGNRHSIASVSRWPVPGGPATARGAVRPANWASRIRNGSPPKWSPCRCDTNTAAIPPGSRPHRRSAGSEVAPQSSSTGSGGPGGPAGRADIAGCRWMQAWNRPPLPNASPEPAKVTVTPPGPGSPGPGSPRSGTEPARDVEPELLARHHGPQPGFQIGQAAGPQRARPPGPDVLEDHRGQGQHLDAARGEAGQLAPPVGVVAGAVHVAELLEPVDRLARGLLGDAEPAPRLGGRGPAQPDRLQREAVRRAHIGMAAARQFSVQFVDDRAEAAEQQQRQLESVRFI